MKLRLRRSLEGGARIMPGQEEKLAVQLKAEKPLALIKEKEYVNILKFLKKGK